MKSLKCHKQTHNRKTDPGIHYPETEEYLMFFKSGKKEAMAYDKNFYSFGYIWNKETKDPIYCEF